MSSKFYEYLIFKIINFSISLSLNSYIITVMKIKIIFIKKHNLLLINNINVKINNLINDIY